MGREVEMVVDLGLVLNLTEARRVGFGGGDGGESRGGVAEMWEPSESESESMYGWGERAWEMNDANGVAGNCVSACFSRLFLWRENINSIASQNFFRAD